MNFRHLGYFVAVAEERHFSRAAQRIGMEQSPLSRAIRSLERDLGVALLHRSIQKLYSFISECRHGIHDFSRAELTPIASSHALIDSVRYYRPEVRIHPH
jgi:hypothetical protein